MSATPLGLHEPPSFAFEAVSSVVRYVDMSFVGSLQEVLDGMQHMNSPVDAGKFWAPARIVRAVIDSEIAQGQARIDLVNSATSLAIGMYKGSVPIEHTENLRGRLKEYGLLSDIVAQGEDIVTCGATAPDLSRSNAERLFKRKDHKSLLMIPLCHGGLVAGIETYLYLQQKQPEVDMPIYPVRFSRAKQRDPHPFMSAAEEEYIHELGRGRTIVLYDEDAFTGQSIAKAVTYLRARHGSKIIGMANADKRLPLAKYLQGRQWQRHQDGRWKSFWEDSKNAN